MRYWKSLLPSIPTDIRVSIIVVTYRNVPAISGILHCIENQTYRNHETIVVHDGPDEHTSRFVNGFPAEMIRYYETPERKNIYGHNCRELGISKASGKYIVVTNDDNYYVPVFLEWMISAAQKTDADIVFCNMVHSHRHWMPVETSMRRKFIDIGCAMFQQEIIQGVRWGSSFAEDWEILKSMLMNQETKIVKVPGCLFVHN